MTHPPQKGRKIKAWRKYADNISQGKLAELIGVSRQMVNYWENHRNEPKDKRMVQIADKLRIPEALR